MGDENTTVTQAEALDRAATSAMLGDEESRKPVPDVPLDEVRYEGARVWLRIADAIDEQNRRKTKEETLRQIRAQHAAVEDGA